MTDFNSVEDYVQHIEYHCSHVLATVAMDHESVANEAPSVANDTHSTFHNYSVEFCQNYFNNEEAYNFKEIVRIQRIYVPILFGLTFIFGVIGNSLVVIVIAKQCSFKVGYFFTCFVLFHFYIFFYKTLHLHAYDISFLLTQHGIQYITKH